MQTTTYQVEMYGKSLDVVRGEDGKFVIPNEVREVMSAGTALKPSWEPICLARKPLSESTVAANVLRWGTGALNIDGCRVGDEILPESVHGVSKIGTFEGAKGNVTPERKGRWPANIVHDGSDEVLEALPHTTSGKPCGVKAGNNNNVFGQFSGGIPVTGFGDSGSTARFFYCAKASRSDRDEGLEAFTASAWPTLGNGIGGQPDQQVANNKNIHPTVKPTDLMRWLCRLVTPPGGTVLDPFMGSGSTGKAAVWEGMQFVGCEREAEYMPIAEARIAFAVDRKPPQPGKPKPKAAANDNATLDLFGGKARTRGGNRMSDGGIMAGKGGFGFRIRERRGK